MPTFPSETDLSRQNSDMCHIVHDCWRLVSKFKIESPEKNNMRSRDMYVGSHKTGCRLCSDWFHISYIAQQTWVHSL